MPAAALRALLRRSIDYAGLFPPAQLELQPALRNHANYTRSGESWMLNTFVLPVAEFDAASTLLEDFQGATPLQVSALGAKSDDLDTFVSGMRSVADSLRGFSAANQSRVQLTQLEMPLPPNATAPPVQEAVNVLDEFGLQLFFEAPPAGAEDAIAMLAECNTTKSGGKLGYKLRTGGVTAGAFPPVAEVAAALIAAARYEVPIKFTAGLHHPVRRHDESVATKMHGFLNVFGAGVLTVKHSLDQKRVVAILEEEEAAPFKFADNEFRFQDLPISTGEIEEARRLITSFGSCSFDEPREDLRAAQLLP